MADIAAGYPATDHPEPEWTLGERIRKCRKLMGLEQDEFGALFGVSGSLVSKWEKGTREPKFSQVKDIETRAPVPKNFLSRSKCVAPGALRLLPGGSKDPNKMNQTPLPLFATAADN